MVFGNISRQFRLNISFELINLEQLYSFTCEL